MAKLIIDVPANMTTHNFTMALESAVGELAHALHYFDVLPLDVGVSEDYEVRQQQLSSIASAVRYTIIEESLTHTETDAIVKALEQASILISNRRESEGGL